MMELAVKLPVKFKEKWIQALRSGDYKKGCFHLRSNDLDPFFCVLGVSMDINLESAADREAFWNPDIYRSYAHRSGLPTGVSKALMQEIVPDSEGQRLTGRPTVATFLSTKNDEGWTFSKLSKWIEFHL